MLEKIRAVITASYDQFYVRLYIAIILTAIMVPVAYNLLHKFIEKKLRIKKTYDYLIHTSGSRNQTMGVIEGNNTFVILKTGEKGNIFGYKNKWLKIACRLHRKYGCSIITSTTHHDNYDELADVLEVIKNTTNDYASAKIYLMGLSNGALSGLHYGWRHPEINRMLLVNTNFADGFQFISPCLNNFTGEKIVFIHGENDPSYQIALLLAKEDAPNCKMAVFKNTDHNFTGKLKEFIELPEKYLFA